MCFCHGFTILGVRLLSLEQTSNPIRQHLVALITVIPLLHQEAHLFWYCSMQSPVLVKIPDVFPPSAAFTAPSSSMKARHQGGRNLLVSLRFHPYSFKSRLQHLGDYHPPRSAKRSERMVPNLSTMLMMMWNSFPKQNLPQTPQM